MTDNLAAVWQKTVRKDMDIRAFGGIHVNDRCADITPEIQVQKLLELGCDGIKLMCSPDLRRYMKSGFDSPKYSKMFGLLEECEIPMNIHIADPEDFWDEGKPYANGLFPSKKQIYEEIFRVLDAHPKLRVTFAHFFFLSNFPEEAERVMEKYPNVCFDITPGVEMYYNFDKKIDVWHDFFTKYSNRILFGTDCNANKTCNDELVELVRRKITEIGTCSLSIVTVRILSFEDCILIRNLPKEYCTAIFMTVSEKISLLIWISFMNTVK